MHNPQSVWSSYLTQRHIKLQLREPTQFKTITADNGTEFNQYPEIEKATGAIFYFANPHHSWERGTIENTNGLNSTIRSLTFQYKRQVVGMFGCPYQKLHS